MYTCIYSTVAAKVRGACAGSIQCSGLIEEQANVTQSINMAIVQHRRICAHVLMASRPEQFLFRNSSIRAPVSAPLVYDQSDPGMSCVYILGAEWEEEEEERKEISLLYCTLQCASKLKGVCMIHLHSENLPVSVNSSRSKVTVYAGLGRSVNVNSIRIWGRPAGRQRRI